LEIVVSKHFQLQLQIVNALLWAAAIIASALFQAPGGLTVVVLPTLAFVSLLYMLYIATRACAELSDPSSAT
jgi:hypothetical protein